MDNVSGAGNMLLEQKMFPAQEVGLDFSWSSYWLKLFKWTEYKIYIIWNNRFFEKDLCIDKYHDLRAYGKPNV